MKGCVVILPLLGCLLGACQYFAVPQRPGVVVTAVPIATPTAAVCAPPPAGMSLQIIPVSETSVLIEISGLQPGERPTLVVRYEDARQSIRHEIHPNEPVGEDGHLQYRETNMDRLDVGAPNRWRIEVHSSQGVACADVMLR